MDNKDKSIITQVAAKIAARAAEGACACARQADHRAHEAGSRQARDRRTPIQRPLIDGLQHPVRVRPRDLRLQRADVPAQPRPSPRRAPLERHEHDRLERLGRPGLPPGRGLDGRSRPRRRRATHAALCAAFRISSRLPVVKQIGLSHISNPRGSGLFVAVITAPSLLLRHSL